jgi:hypothetical protein
LTGGGIVVVGGVVVGFPMPELKTAEKRTESKDLWESDVRLLVRGALGSPGAASGCGKAVGFCGQD